MKDHQNAVVDEALQRIAHDYYRPMSSSTLNNGSIAGAVASLDDRFSHYLTPNEFREFNAPPHFAGIGVDVDPLHAGPADRARLRLLARLAHRA